MQCIHVAILVINLTCSIELSIYSSCLHTTTYHSTLSFNAVLISVQGSMRVIGVECSNPFTGNHLWPG